MALNRQGGPGRAAAFQAIVQGLTPPKTAFKTLSGRPAFSKSYELLVPYSLSGSAEASILGRAYGHLARLLIARKFPQHAADATDTSAARRGLEVLEYLSLPGVYAELCEQFCMAQAMFERFAGGGGNVREVIPAACLCARLEHIIYSGRHPEAASDLLEAPSEGMFTELEQLCAVFSDRMLPALLSGSGDVLLRPTYGAALAVLAPFAATAQADVIIGGTLCEFKTTKLHTYSGRDAAHLTACYLLHLLDGQLGDSGALAGREITHLAICRARYGEVELLDVAAFDREALITALRQLR